MPMVDKQQGLSPDIAIQHDGMSVALNFTELNFQGEK